MSRKLLKKINKFIDRGSGTSDAAEIGGNAGNGDADEAWETACSTVLSSFTGGVTSIVAGGLADALCEDTNPLNSTEPTPHIDSDDMDSLSRMAKAMEDVSSTENIDADGKTKGGLTKEQRDAAAATAAFLPHTASPKYMVRLWVA